MLFSVVVPTRNRPASLSRCLQALQSLDFPSSDFEIIVVDDGSRPAAAAPDGIRLFRQHNQGPAAALNLGASHSRGKYLVFLDDDCLPHPQWLRAFNDAIANNPGCLYAGTTRNGRLSNLLAAANQQFATVVSTLTSHTSNPFRASNNLCIAKSTFESLESVSTSGKIEPVPQALVDRYHHPQSLRAHAACFAAFFAAIALPIHWLGGFSAEFAGPDEAAHLVSGIMVHQYLVEGLWRAQSPLAFATDYYSHYPKVAIGHWPPLFYVLQAFWFAVAGLSRVSVMALSIGVTALLGSATAAWCRTRSLAWPAAFAAGLMVVLSPQALTSTLEFSSDALVALLTFLACLSVLPWLRSQSWPAGLCFALLAAAACLTKGNAFPLLLVPFLVLLALRDWSLLRRLSFWTPLLLTALLVLPWYWIQRDIMIHEIVPGATNSLSGRILFSARWNLLHIPLAGGPALFLLALAATPLVSSALPLALLPIACWLFMSFLSPHTDNRLWIAVIPAFACIAALRLHQLRLWLVPALSLLALLTAHALQPVSHKPQFGFVPAVAASAAFSCPSTLIASNGFGEGAWISELALHQPSPHLTIHRASKLFQRSLWMGENLRILVDSPAALLQTLDRHHIDCLVLHNHRGSVRLPYQRHIDSAMRDWPSVALADEIQLFRRPR